MLLRAPAPDIMVPEVHMYISQPRRIAAKALVERVRSCEPEFKDMFALRMGHGWKEYESDKTRCWFVTTGEIKLKMRSLECSRGNLDSGRFHLAWLSTCLMLTHCLAFYFS